MQTRRPRTTMHRTCTQRLLLVALCLALLPLCSLANLLSPDYPDATGGYVARLWSVRSPGVGPLSFESDLNSDYASAILQMDDAYTRVSRVAEIAVASGYSGKAIRWWNNTARVTLPSGVHQYFDGITALSSSGLHLCLLSVSHQITCFGDSTLVNTGVLFEHRSDVAYSEISTAMWTQCALRLDDSRLECYAVDINGALSLNMTTSIWTYRGIGAWTGGVCGITLTEGDLRCHTAAGLAEQLVFPAPTLPLFFRSAVPGGFILLATNCAVLSNGALMCQNLPYALPAADQQTVLFDQIIMTAQSFVGSVAATAQTIYLDSGGTSISASERYFYPMRFLAVDPLNGDDATCACIITLDLAAVAAFTACQTLSRATQLLTHANTWLQILPGTHAGGDLALPISDLTLSSQPPPCFSVDELAQVANGTWVTRMADAAATGAAVTIDCTGFTNCFTSSFYNLVFVGLNFTGSAQHALVSMTAPSYWGDVDVSIHNCGFSRIGGMLKKTSGVVVVSHSSMTDATEDSNVLGLIELSEVMWVTVNNTRFERNVATNPTVTIRACLHFASVADDALVRINRCWFSDNSAVYTSDGESPGIGGVAVRLSVWRVQAEIDSCSFIRNVVAGADEFELVAGGAVAVSTLNLQPILTGIQSIFVTLQSCFFEGNGALNGNGGSLYVSEVQLQYGDDMTPLHAAAAVVVRNTQVRNTTARNGGAFWFGILASLEMTGVSFTNCDAAHAGAVSLTQIATRSRTPLQTPFVFSNLVFTNTRCLFEGGAMQISSVTSPVSFQHCSFTNTYGGNGGAVYVSASRPVTMSDVRFENSVAHEAGGAIFLLSTASLTIDGLTSQGSQATSSGGFLSSTNSALSLTSCTVTDSNLNSPAGAGFRLLVAKAGGAIRVVGGSLSVSLCTFQRCSALPFNGLSACADSYDASAGVCASGTGGAISAELAAPVIMSSTFVDCAACSGAAVFIKSTDYPNLSYVTARSLEAFSGSLFAAVAVSMPSVDGCTVESSVARRAGGAIVFSGCGDGHVGNTHFTDVRCIPLQGDPNSCDGGVMWSTSPRQFFNLGTFGNKYERFSVSLRDSENPGGAGGVLFIRLDLTTALLALGQPKVTFVNDSTLENVFNLTDSRAMFGLLQATTVVALSASVAQLTLYPGQSLADLPAPLLVYALDGYGQRMTQNRGYIVRVRCVAADGNQNASAMAAAAAVYFTGSILQEVDERTGAGNFGDLRVFAPPGRYWLSFSLTSSVANTTHVDLTVRSVCPPKMFYDSAIFGCVECPSDVLAFNATSNTCEKCPAGWQRVARNDSSGPLRDGVFCEVCPLGQVSTEGSICASCGPNTYQPTRFSPCIACSNVVGLLCAGDGLAQVQTNFFGLTTVVNGEQRIETFQCPSGFCTAAKLQKPGTGGSSAVTAYDQCAYPRLASPTNLLCGECAEGYRPWGTKCSKCEETNGPLMLLVFVLSFGLCFWLLRSALIVSSAGHAVVIVYFVQTVMLELGTINNLLSWLNFTLFSPNSTSDCITPLTPFQQVQAQVLMPVALEVELIMIGLIHFAAFKRWGKLAASEPTPSAKAPFPVRARHAVLRFFSLFSLDVYINATLSLMLFSYTQVCAACVNYMQCVDVGGVSVVFNQPAMHCDTDEYRHTRGLVLATLILYVSGFPAGIALFLIVKRKPLRDAYKFIDQRLAAEASGSPPPSSATPAARFVSRYAPLFAMYSPGTSFWQLFVVSRRICFVTIAVLLVRDPQQKFMAFVLAHVVSQLAQLIAQPFRFRLLNAADFVAHLLLIVISATLSAHPPPDTSGGIDLFIFLLVVPPLCVYPIVVLLEHRREKKAADAAAAAAASKRKQAGVELGTWSSKPASDGKVGAAPLDKPKPKPLASAAPSVKPAATVSSPPKAASSRSSPPAAAAAAPTSSPTSVATIASPSAAASTRAAPMAVETSEVHLTLPPRSPPQSQASPPAPLVRTFNVLSGPRRVPLQAPGSPPSQVQSPPRVARGPSRRRDHLAGLLESAQDSTLSPTQQSSGAGVPL